MPTKPKTRPLGRPLHSVLSFNGSGPLCEVRRYRQESGEVMAALLGLKAPVIWKTEREGRAPYSREARHILLNMAVAIPEPARSPELDAWIAEQEIEFRARPLGGAFL